MTMHLFCTWLFLFGHCIAAEDEYLGMFSLTTKEVCPGQSFYMVKMAGFHQLYFKSAVLGSTDQLVANRTHIFFPSFEYQGRKIVLPEVTKRHEGEYFWALRPKFDDMYLRTRLIIKDCSVYKEHDYGRSFTLTVPKEASVLEFLPPKSKDRWVLWSRINNMNRNKGVVKIDEITHSNAGHYTFLKESGVEISSVRLAVKEIETYRDISDTCIEESFTVLITEAVLTFTGIDSSQDNKHVLFKNGIITEEAFQIFGSRMNLQALGSGGVLFTIQDLNSADRGDYEVRDKNGGRVSTIYVEENSDYSQLPVPIGVAIVIGTLVICCCCVRKRCCQKKDTPVASSEPEELPVNVHDPVAMPASGNSSRYPPVVRPIVLIHSPVANTTPMNRDSQPPPYDAVIGNSVPFSPYSSTAPQEASAWDTGGEPSAPMGPGPQFQPQGWPEDFDDFVNSFSYSTSNTTSTTT